MRRLTCAVAVIALLGGCSNYVSTVTPYELNNGDDLRVDSYRDGERYVRIMKEKFEAKVRQLENEENFWRLGILGGGVTTLVGVIGKHPHTAIVGAGVAGGSYVYGQAFGPEVLRRIYLNGDAALNCVLLAGTKMNAEFSSLQYHIDAVQEAKNTLIAELDAATKAAAGQTSYVQKAVAGFVQKERVKLKEVDRALVSWNLPGAVVGRRMAVTSDIIRTQVNRLVKENEPTLSSLYAATGKTGAIGVSLVEGKYEKADPGNENTFGNVESFVHLKQDGDDDEVSAIIAKAIAASAALEVVVADARAAVDRTKEVTNLDQFDSCTVADVDTPTLTFTPSDLTLTQGSKLSVIVTGGRPPYTWLPVGTATTEVVVTPSSFTSNSAAIQIEAKDNATPGSYDFAFSSLHPKATAQIVKINVKAKE